MPEHRKHYPGSRSSASLARHAIVQFAASCGFYADDLWDIESAVGEALANAAEHGQQGQGGFDVHAKLEGDALVIEVKDRGFGFEHWRAIDCAQPPCEASRGFGIYIMRQLMDDIRYSDRGRVLRLIKRLRSAAPMAARRKYGKA